MRALFVLGFLALLTPAAQAQPLPSPYEVCEETLKEICPLDEIVIVPPSPRCVPVAHDLETRRYLCVDLSDASCAVYLWVVSGSSESKHCYVVGDSWTIGAVEGVPLETRCVPTSGGLDYPSYLCVDPSNVRCVVYHETTSDWGTRRLCIPGI